MGDQIPYFIRDVMPADDDAAHLAALENVRAYLRVVGRIHQRLMEEGTSDSTKSEKESESQLAHLP